MNKFVTVDSLQMDSWRHQKESKVKRKQLKVPSEIIIVIILPRLDVMGIVAGAGLLVVEQIAIVKIMGIESILAIREAASPCSGAGHTDNMK